jgi:hypothetical protein
MSKEKPNMKDADFELLANVAKLVAFKEAIIFAFDEHPNQMDAAKADHDFVLAIAKIVEIFQSPDKTFQFNPVEVMEEKEGEEEKPS